MQEKTMAGFEAAKTPVVEDLRWRLGRIAVEIRNVYTVENIDGLAPLPAGTAR